MISMPEIKKENNSANNVSGVTSFNLCKKAGHALHCLNVDVVNLCMSSGHALYLCQVS